MGDSLARFTSSSHLVANNRPPNLETLPSITVVRRRRIYPPMAMDYTVELESVVTQLEEEHACYIVEGSGNG
ncbi:hypothetical protein Ccrd_017107 [Cynara cardunculus var. scolymus]|uniref:Uncharacterized protein n=1 Tax=Cynara cardunculus var. scolymus TaxID=59895 RepID=A0A124SFW8_CYNCS|nr:hypothetical protein Ccrd_017107 [Cynara cardunculus var. scolymus]